MITDENTLVELGHFNSSYPPPAEGIQSLGNRVTVVFIKSEAEDNFQLHWTATKLCKRIFSSVMTLIFHFQIYSLDSLLHHNHLQS